jgi:AAA+ superfamily predicted ATPase
VATTNYIEHLDAAIADRPMRFNRKYKFELPSPREIDMLVDLYFKECNISPVQKALCYNKRSAKLLSHKRQKPISEVFDEAVQIVSQNFYIPERKAGFRRDDDEPNW